MIQGSVYFARSMDGAVIKIGFSTNVENRLKELSSGGGYGPLERLGVIPGNRSVEKSIQRSLSTYVINGEWFRPDENLLVSVNSIIAAGEWKFKTGRHARVTIPVGSLPEDRFLECRAADCGHQWVPRVDNPKECPACKSRYWRDGENLK